MCITIMWRCPSCRRDTGLRDLEPCDHFDPANNQGCQEIGKTGITPLFLRREQWETYHCKTTYCTFNDEFELQGYEKLAVLKREMKENRLGVGYNEEDWMIDDEEPEDVDDENEASYHPQGLPAGPSAPSTSRLRSRKAITGTRGAKLIRNPWKKDEVEKLVRLKHFERKTHQQVADVLHNHSKQSVQLKWGRLVRDSENPGNEFDRIRASLRGRGFLENDNQAPRRGAQTDPISQRENEEDEEGAERDADQEHDEMEE